MKAEGLLPSDSCAQPCCFMLPFPQIHAINERIVDFGEALQRALPDGEGADIGRTSVAEVTQVWERMVYYTLELTNNSYPRPSPCPLST